MEQMATISQMTHAARSDGIFEGVNASIIVSNGCCISVMFHEVLSMVLFKEREILLLFFKNLPEVMQPVRWLYER